MSKVQCTFRLPEEVVSLIDKQEGVTRTDKLLSLLGFDAKTPDYTVMQSVIKSDWEERFSELEDRILSLEKVNSQHHVLTHRENKKPSNTSYEDRTRDVIARCRSAWEALSKEEQKMITKKGFAELSGVARGTVTKYWDIFTSEKT